MSKILKDAALIVGGIALAATGVGALAEAGAFGLSAAVGAAAGFGSFGALASVASIASVAAGGLAFASSLLAKPAKPTVSPMQWSADPQRGVPYAMGRCYVAGDIVYRKAWGGSNKYQTIVTIYTGAGPVQSVDTLYVDGVARSVAGDSTVNLGGNTGNMNAGWQIGLTPTGAPLGLGPPDWTDASRLSGYAASTITLTYDTQGHHTMTSTPSCGFVGHWVKAYDPRRDSTYPGGAGSHRVDDESTWEWSENPYLHGLTWILGRKQNGKRVLGAGAPTNAIITAQFVEGANICDANGWTMGGKVYSTDDKWDSLKRILQAGSGEPVRLGAQIGCIINTPRVSLATITEADIWGDASVQTTQARRDRLNAIVPRYMAEQDVTTQDEDGNLVTAVTWGIVAGSPVVVQDYVTFDGEQRQKEVEYTFVQNLTQAQQLARYDIENAREFGPITLPLRLRWMGYKPGDVITANLPELNLNGQDILLLQRELSPQDGIVTMTARSETYAKHAYALGQTGTPPATPSVSGPPLVPVPGESAWALVGGTQTSAGGATIPVLSVTGASDSSVIDAVIFEYRTSQTEAAAAGAWVTASSQPPSIEQLNITGLQDQTSYDVAVSYQLGVQISSRLILGPAIAGLTSVPWQTGVTGPGRPDNGATVGAPAGTLVAEMEAAALVAELANHTTSIADITTAIGPIPTITADVADLQAASTDLLGQVDALTTGAATIATQVGVITGATLPAMTTTLTGLAAASIDEQAARRQLQQDGDALAQGLLRALTEANRTRTVMSDAGIYIDPASGKARIYATDEQADQIAQVQIALDAATAQIALKASVDYVAEQIALAVIDPSQVASLDDIIARLTSAEADIDGLDATVALKADATTLTALSGTVSSLSTQLDALAGTVTTKADSTTVDALGAQLASVQETLTAIGDTSSYGLDIRQARTAADDAAEAGLRGLVAADAAARAAVTQAAEIQSELTTKIVAGLSAEATSRLALAATMAGNQANVLTQISALATSDSAQTAQLASMSATIGGQAAEIASLTDIALGGATTTAGLSTEIRQARYASDTDAESALRALVAGDTTGRNLATQLTSLQFQLTTTIVTGLSSEAAARLALTARMGAAEASIVSTNTALATLSQSTADQLSILSSQLNDGTSGLPATRAALATESTTRATADSANASAISGLSAQVNDAATGLPVTRSQLATESTTRSTGDSTNATAISALSSQVNNPTTGLPATVAALSTEATTRASADSANATSISSLASEVHNSTTGLAATSAALATEASTRSTSDSAIASSVSSLSSQVNDPSTGLPATAAALATEIAARTTATSANASSLAALSATVGSNTASISNLQEVIVDPSGTTARAVLQVDANGNIAGIVETADGTGSSRIGLIAGITEIVGTDGTLLAAFEEVGGLAYIPNLMVDTLKDNTAMVPVRSVDTSGTAGSYGGAQTTIYSSIPAPTTITALTKTITMPVRGYIDVDAWGKLDLPSGNAPWRTALAINGAVMAESTRGGNAPNDSLSMSGSVLVDPGTYTITYLFSGHTSVTLSNKSLRANGYPATS